MCREALKGFLAEKAQLTPDAAAKFVDSGDVTSINESQAQKVIDALNGLKAVDPAGGSGAYLLGLLHELIRLHRLLMSEKLKRDPKWLYNRKLQIISHSLYGVDKDLFATNIAMLRLWLSLAIEADDPVALPHLEFKIETGDAVIGPDPQAMPGLREHYLIEKADKLIDLKDRFLRSQGREAAALFAQIESEQKELAFKLRGLRGEGVVDWRIQFAEVFVKNSGFDVVLANPPYVRQELIGDTKPQLRANYSEHFSGQADLYIYFYLRAFQLLRDGGMLVFISSNKWFRAGYGRPLRRFVASQCTVKLILDFNDLPVFESAMAYPMIFIAARTAPPEGHAPVLAEPSSLSPPYPNVTSVVARFGHRLASDALDPSGEWRLTTSIIADRLRTMRNGGVPLDKIVQGRIYAGIKTGLNDAFIIDEGKRGQLIEEQQASEKLIKPFLKGKDISRWVCNAGGRYIIYVPHGTDIAKYPAIKRHLAEYKADLQKRALDQEWFELQQPQQAFTRTFEGEKIVYPNVALGCRFTIERGSYLDMTAFCIDSDDRFLLGVLNSAAMSFYFAQLGIQRRGGYQEFKTQYVRSLPIPQATPVEQNVIRATAQCLIASHLPDAAPTETSAARDTLMKAYLERILNALVYGLYFREELASPPLLRELVRQEIPSSNVTVGQVRAFFDRVYHTTSPVRATLDDLQSKDLVRSIESQS